MIVTESAIGSWVVVIHENECMVGTVMDLVAGTNTPKRIRIQRGRLQGQVLQPHQYQFKSFLSETDVDD